MAYARQVKRRRGTESENNVFTGAEGEIVVDTTNHRLRVHDGATVGGFPLPNMNDINAVIATINQSIQALQNQINSLEVVKTGMIIPWGGATLPAGRWLWAKGDAVSRTDYADLYNIYHTYFGAGDGHSTFNLPNTDHYVLMHRGNVAIGETWKGSIPTIWGAADLRCESDYKAAFQAYDGAFYRRGNSANIARPASSGRGTYDYGLDFNASRYNPIYSWEITDSVYPRNLNVNFILKY